MTVAELIEKLRSMPQGMTVQVYYGHEAELNDAETVEVTESYYTPGSVVVIL